MVFETRFVRKAYIQMLTNEMKKVVRSLRAFPVERLDARDTDCGRSARELAEGFIAHLRRLDALASGSDWAVPVRGERSRGVIMLEIEACYLSAHASLDTISPASWSEVIPSPLGLSPWSQARRGELLWMALRNLIRHGRHFTQHVRAACSAPKFEGFDGGSRVPVSEIESAGVGAGA
jgi:hypothetical protein